MVRNENKCLTPDVEDDGGGGGTKGRGLEPCKGYETERIWQGLSLSLEKIFSPRAFQGEGVCAFRVAKRHARL